MRVLLVEPKTTSIAYNLALLKWARFCDNNGHEYQYVRGNIKHSIHKKKEYYDPTSEFSITPDKIFISCIFSFYSKKYEETIDYYHNMFPDAEIVIGGVFPSLNPEWFKKDKWIGGFNDNKITIHQGRHSDIENLVPKYDCNIIDDDWINGTEKQKENVKKKRKKIVLYTSRGCVNKCGYCLHPHTNILTNDLSVKKMDDIEIGDEIYGVRQDKFWKFEKTKVLDKRYNIKEAFKIVMEDGRELICSDDHRWLTSGRGWKYTTPCDGLCDMSGNLKQSVNGRPYLTTNSNIHEVSKIYETPEETVMYKCGYLSGMIKGDGTINEVLDKRSGWTSLRFRLALIDLDALERTAEYMRFLGLHASEISLFQEETETTNSVYKITNDRKYEVKQLMDAIDYKDDPEFYRGWLAGIFDSEGSINPQIRIHNSDIDILEFTEKSLNSLDISYSYGTPRQSVNVVVQSIILGKIDDNIKFFQLTNPIISRKRKSYLDGRSPEHGKRVMSIESLGMMELIDIETECENFIANGFISHNCAVPKLEGKQVNFNTIRPYLEAAKSEIPDATSVVLYDNNFTEQTNVKEIVDELVEFDYAVDIHGLHVEAFTPEFAKEISRLKFRAQGSHGTPYMRFSFDKMKYEPSVWKAMKTFSEANIKAEFFCYMLYNWIDSPEDFWKRIIVSHDISRTYNRNIYLFPQRYEPFMSLEKYQYTGKHWTPELASGVRKLSTWLHGFITCSPSLNIFNWIGYDLEEFKERCISIIDNNRIDKKEGDVPDFEHFLKQIK